ncbi:MAG: flagellar hook capping FlgD N-terminal domain-containing protein [bacterium]|nr:flagellar hook capping FlgD N-terminal domain-containing protein [bacterium]
MASVIDNVVNGSVNKTEASNTANSTTTAGGSSLGKDAFLQLLVTQMKYQDPLNPSSDTEYISQLATFSQLEELQNLNTSYSQTQAYSLVGKTVALSTTDSTGTTSYVTGTVDYVTMSGGNAYVVVNGNKYSLDNVLEVYDDGFILSLGTPDVEKSEVTYDHDNASDVTVTIDLGKTSVATALAVIVNNQAIDTQYLSLSGDKLTIKADAFKDLEEGTYDIIFSFNDALNTVVNNKVTLTIKGEPVATEDTSDEETSTEDASTEGAEETI